MLKVSIFLSLQQMRCSVQRSFGEIEVALRKIRLIFPSCCFILEYAVKIK